MKKVSKIALAIILAVMVFYVSFCVVASCRLEKAIENISIILEGGKQ
ncbi:MAG: hypothetical protein WDA47_03175 [Bacilli bacterium]|jgi:hypothetical protein|nr:hypothetical protein [Candidatus Saccharicenans sp.]